MLMQENLGFAMIAEVPCVYVGVMRRGSCRGVAIVPVQGDLMQLRWGTHGDHPVIALMLSSVPEIYTETMCAFSLAERFRMPVCMLSDATLAHMSEKVRVDVSANRVERRKPAPRDRDYLSYYRDADGIAPHGLLW